MRLFLLFASLLMLVAAQAPVAYAQGASRPLQRPTSGELQIGIRKLSMLGSVLFVAAHPDDENTALLSYLSQGRGARVAYLSVTRGSGGQNLIGPEIGDALGAIRTQELLEARRIDGADQFFTGALDFGYSKSADEALEKWGHDRVLAEVVWIVRSFRPDVVITRFPPEGRTHGHHTASARLALEAFEAAGDPTRYADQLAYVEPWRPRRVVWNVFRPRGSSEEAQGAHRISVDVGAFNPLLGKSYAEIAGESRSMHKSQGFGAPERRGSLRQYFELLAGDPVKSDLFEGIEWSWSRVRGGEVIGRLLEEAERQFDPAQPSAVVPTLLRAYAAMGTLSEDPLVQAKREDLAEIIRGCAGLWLEAIADRPGVSPGDTLHVTFSALLRSGAGLTLERIEIPAGWGAGNVLGGKLDFNEPLTREASLTAPRDAPFTLPYGSPRGNAGDARRGDEWPQLGWPETPPVVEARFLVRAGGQVLEFAAPLLYREVDRVHGERHRRVQVVPPVSARFEEDVRVFPDATPREAVVIVRAHRDSVGGGVRPLVPAGWKAEPEVREFSLASSGDEAVVSFRLTPGPGATTSDLVAQVETRDVSYSAGFARIDYPHIPAIDLFPEARLRLVRADVKRLGDHVGYVMGSGDRVPEALRQIGYRVTLLTDDDIAGGGLGGFDAIVTGVRAYNTRPRLAALQPRLLEYVERGGTLVVQYNTVDRSLDGRLGPHAFALSRDRVSVEEAPVRILDERHVLLTRPNRIGPVDFDGWVQERGLYFASDWDRSYQTPLASADPGEDSLQGGLLYARHGKGVFIYTGLSFFRELPAGVPGAYRLFANLVSARP